MKEALVRRRLRRMVNARQHIHQRRIVSTRGLHLLAAAASPTPVFCCGVHGAMAYERATDPPKPLVKEAHAYLGTLAARGCQRLSR